MLYVIISLYVIRYYTFICYTLLYLYMLYVIIPLSLYQISTLVLVLNECFFFQRSYLSAVYYRHFVITYWDRRDSIAF